MSGRSVRDGHDVRLGKAEQAFPAEFAADARLVEPAERRALVHFGGIFDSGTGTRFGGTANPDAFTETGWVTIRGDIAPYPF